MQGRRRALLRAEGKFLSDYGSEDALHRWREKLSDVEWEPLTRLISATVPSSRYG